MRPRGLLITLRNVLIPVVLAILLLVIVFVAYIYISNRGINNMNPFESFALRLSLSMRNAELERPAGTDSTPICFTVSQGDTAGTIASKLVGQGFNIDPELFRNYVRYHDLDSRLQAGTFLLARTLKISEIAYKLGNARADTVNFRVIEGWRLEEIAELIDRTPDLPFRGADFLALVGPGAGSQPGPIGEFAARVGLPAGRSLEGFLFPDTYSLPACGNAELLVVRMLQNFDVRVSDQTRAEAKSRGLSLYEVVTLASIVQREVVIDEERPRIAGVYLNRYKNGLSAAPNPSIPVKLDADPTVQYALGNTRNPSTWWPAITASDYLGVSSPYNTYVNRGLPPSPISNPGLASIQAAANPEENNFAFFRACPGDGGRHRFSATLAEHNVACQ